MVGVYRLLNDKYTLHQTLTGVEFSQVGQGLVVTPDGGQLIMSGDGNSSHNVPGVIHTYSLNVTGTYDRTGTTSYTKARDYGLFAGMSDDGLTVVTGAGKDSKVLVYSRTVTNGVYSALNLKQTITGKTGEMFGNFVTLSGDGSTLCVTNVWSDDTPHVYVYKVNEDGNFTLFQKLGMDRGAGGKLATVSFNGDTVIFCGAATHGLDVYRMNSGRYELHENIKGEGSRFATMATLTPDASYLYVGVPAYVYKLME